MALNFPDPNISQEYISDDGVVYTWDGEKWISDGIPAQKGEKGAIGPGGGDSAYDIWLAQGNSGTEEDFIASLKGEQGEEGLSSYEVWLIDNPDGTEAEYFDSIKGQKGEVGEALVFDDLTDDQKLDIKGQKGEVGEQGDLGDPFVYDDFTDDQLEDLKGEPGNITFPTGTAMVFRQANPPISWTIDETNNESALRVTSSSGFGGGTGGSVNFTDAFKNQSLSGGGGGTTDPAMVPGGGGNSTSSVWIEGYAQNARLQEGEMPTHQHNVNAYSNGGNLRWDSGSNYSSNNLSTTNAGSSNEHNHPWANSSAHFHTFWESGGGSHSHGFDASFSSSVNLTVKYANVIIGVKN